MIQYCVRSRTWRTGFFLALLATLPVSAQIGGGSLVGNISDPSGAAVADVKVTALNVATNTASTTSTNAAGYYEFPLLPAGRYRVEAEATGFQKAGSADFTLNSGTRPKLDLTLKLGQVSESVDVTAQAPLVNATTTDLGVVIERGKVEALPLNGRNFQQLVSLQAGVVSRPSSSAGGRGGIEFHGSSALANNLMLDGVDMSFGEVNGTASDTSAGGGGALVNTVSVEAIEEFKATGSAFSAEYGRSAGGVLNVTTKSGTNQFHGALFEFFRNDKLDANTFFNNRSRLVRPDLRWNQFGGNIGGPIRRNRAFFFFNYEGAQVKRAATLTGNVPTPALLTRLKPEIRNLYESTLPNQFEPTANPFVGFHRRNDRRSNDENTYLGRGDIDIGHHRLSGRYSHNNQDFLIPNLQPSLPRIFPNRFHNAALQDNWSIAPTLFNELRIGVNRVDLFRNEPGRERIPAWITVAGVGLNSSRPSFIHFITTTYTLVDNFTWVNGRHSIKTGFEIREVRSVRVQNGQPTHNYNSVDDLIADRSNRIGLLFGGGKGLRNRNYGFYVQDDWRVNARLQLNAGVRYEYYPPFRGGFNVNSSDPFGPFIGTQQSMFRADRNNWGPRAGLVFDPTGKQKWVIRAGAGIGYLPPQAIYFYDMAFIDPRLPFVANFAPADVPEQFRSYPLPQSFVNAVSSNPSLLPRGLILSRQVADYNMRDTYAGQWNFSIQHAATESLALQAAYVGSRTVKAIGPRPLNLRDPALGRRPRTDLGDVLFLENASNISYHSLQLSANQRLRRGMSFDVYYTFGKALVYGAADASITFSNGFTQDPQDIRGSYGPKAGDTRHRFVGVYSWQIPTGSMAKAGIAKALLSGWNLQGILGMRSGLPLNVLSGRDAVGNGRVAGQRPDFVANANPYLKDTDTLTWLTPAAFDGATPVAQRRFGNLGFNALRGPTAFTYDASLHKQFSIRENHRMTFRVEAFNWLNHTTMGNPNTTLNNPNFGQILSAGDPRNIQLALKYAF